MTGSVLVLKLALLGGTVVVAMVSGPIRIVLNPRVSMTGHVHVVMAPVLATVVGHIRITVINRAVWIMEHAYVAMVSIIA